MSAIIVGLIVASLLAQTYRPITDASLPEEKRDKSLAFFTALEIFMWLLLVPLGIGSLSALLDGVLYLVPVPILVVALLFPWQFSLRVLVPLGLYRAAYVLGFFCMHKLSADRRGGAVLLATWAVISQKSPSDAALSYIERQLAKEKRYVKGAGIVAAALLARHRGDVEGSRALLTALEGIDPSLFPPVARSVALTLRAIERVAAGDVGGLRLIEAQSLLFGWPHSRLSQLLTTCAMRIVREPVLPGESARPTSKARLYLRWLLAPQRGRTLWLVQRAARRTPSEAPPLPVVSPAASAKTGTALEQAVTALRPLLISGKGAAPISAPLLISVGKAWDAVLADGAAKSLAMSRSLVLGITSDRGGEAALRTLRDDAVGLLQEAIARSDLRLSDLVNAGSDTLLRAVQKVRSQILDAVEGAGLALRERVDSKRSLSSIDEWREWARYLSLYQAARRRGGDEGQRLAWPSFHREACHLAVWLWNDRQQRPLGNCIFRYLLEEAELVADERTADLQRTNVECGL